MKLHFLHVSALARLHLPWVLLSVRSNINHLLPYSLLVLVSIMYLCFSLMRWSTIFTIYDDIHRWSLLLVNKAKWQPRLSAVSASDSGDTIYIVHFIDCSLKQSGNIAILFVWSPVGENFVTDVPIWEPSEWNSCIDIGPVYGGFFTVMIPESNATKASICTIRFEFFMNKVPCILRLNDEFAAFTAFPYLSFGPLVRSTIVYCLCLRPHLAHRNLFILFL